MRRFAPLVAALALALPASAAAADTHIVAHVKTPDGKPLPAGTEIVAGAGQSGSPMTLQPDGSYMVDGIFGSDGVTVLAAPPADSPYLKTWYGQAPDYLSARFIPYTSDSSAGTTELTITLLEKAKPTFVLLPPPPTPVVPKRDAISVAASCSSRCRGTVRGYASVRPAGGGAKHRRVVASGTLTPGAKAVRLRLNAAGRAAARRGFSLQAVFRAKHAKTRRLTVQVKRLR